MLRAGLLCLFLVVTGALAELISREMLFDNPKYSKVTISPDGQDIAFLAPNEFGVSNVFVRCLTCKEASAVTFETKKHISGGLR